LVPLGAAKTYLFCRLDDLPAGRQGGIFFRPQPVYFIVVLRDHCPEVIYFSARFLSMFCLVALIACIYLLEKI
jgi:hypothetical protein